MNMKEGKGVFLKVDSVEPVYKTSFSPCDYGGTEAIKVWIGSEGHMFPCNSYTVCDPDVVREDGRRQVVGLINELLTRTIGDNKKLFGYVTARDILNHFSYDEIVEKLDACKKEKETIHVRDEVENKNNGMKLIVTVPPYIGSNSCCYFSGIRKDGKVYRDEMVNCYKKTDVHVDDLDSYLEV